MRVRQDKHGRKDNMALNGLLNARRTSKTRNKDARQNKTTCSK